MNYYELITEVEELKALLERNELKGEQKQKAVERHKKIMKILYDAETKRKITGIKYLELKKVV